MNRGAAAVALGLALAGRAAAADYRIQVRVSATYPCSLFRLVDSMSDWRAQSAPYYREWWKGLFGDDADERAALENYARLRKAHAGSRAGRGEWPEAFCSSETVFEGLSKLPGLSADETAELKADFDRFDPKFAAYFDDHKESLLKNAETFRAQKWDATVASFLASAARFLESDNGQDYDFDVYLAWQPSLKDSGGRSAAESLGRAQVVQLPEGDALEDHLDAVVHEMVHALIEASPEEVRERLADRLIAKDRDLGLLVATELREGLPTALGQGLFVEQHLPKRFSLRNNWYDSDVDRFAKAIFPALRRAVLAGETLEGAFPEEALAAVSKAYSGKPAPVADYFASAVVLAEPKTAALLKPLLRELHGGDIDSYTQEPGRGSAAEFEDKLKERWNRSALLVLTPEALDDALAARLEGALARADLKGLRERAAQAPRAVIARSARGRVYLLLLGEPKALEARVSKVGKVPCCAAGTEKELK